MKKMLKIVAILLVVAAVVCVAGCSSKKTANCSVHRLTAGSYINS